MELPFDLSPMLPARTPRVLEYAAATGAALLVSPRGEIAMKSGAVAGVDERRVASRCATAPSFEMSGACVHAVPVRDGWTLCVISTAGVSPTSMLERARRAAQILAGGAGGFVPPSPSGSSPSGAPAEARVTKPS